MGHDIKDDLYALMFRGYSNFKTVFDTAIAEYVLDAAKNKYDLKTLVLEMLHLHLPVFEDFVSADTQQLDMFTGFTAK